MAATDPRTWDPYEVLGVAKSATIDEIKAAYRRIAKETHPDLNGAAPSNVQRFRQATDAYAVLADPVQRKRFDETSSVDQESVAAGRNEIFAAVEQVRAVALAAKRVARAAAFKGLAWFTAGAVISGGGYLAAASSPNGGSYPVLWGAMLFGGLQAIKGVKAYLAIDAQARKIEQDIWTTVIA